MSIRQKLKHKAIKQLHIGYMYYHPNEEVDTCNIDVIINDDINVLLYLHYIVVFYKNKVVDKIDLEPVLKDKFKVVGLSKYKYCDNCISYHIVCNDENDFTNYGFRNYTVDVIKSKLYNRLLNVWDCVTNLFSFTFRNPLKTWWKARKYFKMPKPEIHFFGNMRNNCPFASYNYPAHILHVTSQDVMWKWKWDSIRHERDPYIWVCFFRRFGFSINFKIWYNENGKKQDGGMYYWEYLLDYLYGSKDLNKVDQWKGIRNNKEYIIPTQEFSLKECLKQD